MKETLIGSNAIRVSRDANCDVLIVPADAKFGKISCVSLASDLTDIDAESVSETLHHYCKIFGAKAEIIQVKNSFTVPKEERTENRNKIVEGMGHIKTGIVQPYDENTAEAIERHVTLNKSGWLAVIHKDHGFLAGLFHKSLTKQLAFHLEIPILSIHTK